VHDPQSSGQEVQVSEDWQTRSPHVLHTPQSTEHVEQLSVDEQTPSPHPVGSVDPSEMPPSPGW
jgi:hypothetical protein